ncbi:DPP IV N-terminal domain-containing protein [Thermaurantiacus tibetensis]|uniref:S9 family peptidase n=1 Tax=Thermaurantiacus tibetensis TaxID=2759035 RepID=UPI00188E8E03|nr:DPP IV N-terminal domain-containing protein [Thermaurantiacus tibetensis]
MRQALGLLVGAMLMGNATTARDLPLERVFASPPLSGTVPRALTLSPDGRHVAYLKPRAEDPLRSDLWVREVSTGAERLAVDSLALSPAPASLSEAELQRRERARLASARGIVEYRWAPDGRALLVPLDGDLWLQPLDGPARRLTRSEESEVDAKLSPDGRFVSYARGANLFVTEIATGSERAVTTEGEGPVFYGQAEFVAQEEMKRMTGQWWSPDSARLAVTRVDERAVATAVRAAIGSDGTRVTAQRYPFAGTANARVSLEIRALDGGAPVMVDLGPDPDIYLARVTWASPSRLLVQTQPRDQSRIDLLDVDAATGRSRRILSETATAWTNLHDNLKLLRDGGFLWTSERDGFSHLYRFDGRRLVQITRGPHVVDELLAVDEGAGLAFVTGFFETPLEKALYAVRLDGRGRPRRISPAGMSAEAVMDERGTVALVTASSPAQPPQVSLVDREGVRRFWIAENRLEDTPYAPYAEAHVLPRFGTLKAADGQLLHWMMLVPPGLAAGARAPVFLEVYGGPGVQRVRRQWGAMLHQYLVRRGFVVFQIDNRGSANRGTAFEFPIHRRLGTVEVEDQLAGLAWLRQQPFVDPDRVAVYGWSYGGYMALRLMTKAPEAFAAGVAGAPVTDWRLYDTHYTERYLGNPARDPAPYDASAIVPDAARLARPLLLLHGLADDNVVFDHSAKLMAALQAAGRPFETMVYPGQTHAIREPALATHMWTTILAFLERSLCLPQRAGTAPCGHAGKGHMEPREAAPAKGTNG